MRCGQNNAHSLVLSRQFIKKNEFARMFFTNLLYFDSNVSDCNEVLSILIRKLPLQKRTSLAKYLKEHPCSPNGIYVKLTSDIVDPHIFENLFYPDDKMFPLSDFYESIKFFKL